MPTTSTPPPKSSTPSSGAITTANGDLHIPSSTRADGSLRKEIRIRPGYRPPEDVEIYKNRTAEAWKTRGSGGIPGAEGWKSSDGAGAGGTAAGKNAKRREARRKAKAAGKDSEEGADENIEDITKKLEDWKDFSKNEPKTNGSDETPVPKPSTEPELTQEPQLDPEAEKEKQARNLKKKLRQARELREKKDQGESLLPEQFAKVIKIQELIRRLDSLGFDSNGDKKA
ncbi:hypothetical protein ACLMJK_008053 [Lecanora helva]